MINVDTVVASYLSYQSGDTNLGRPSGAQDAGKLGGSKATAGFDLKQFFSASDFHSPAGPPSDSIVSEAAYVAISSPQPAAATPIVRSPDGKTVTWGRYTIQFDPNDEAATKVIDNKTHKLIDIHGDPHFEAKDKDGKDVTAFKFLKGGTLVIHDPENPNSPPLNINMTTAKVGSRDATFVSRVDLTCGEFHTASSDMTQGLDQHQTHATFGKVQNDGVKYQKAVTFDQYAIQGDDLNKVNFIHDGVDTGTITMNNKDEMFVPPTTPAEAHAVTSDWQQMMNNIFGGRKSPFSVVMEFFSITKIRHDDRDTADSSSPQTTPAKAASKPNPYQSLQAMWLTIQGIPDPAKSNLIPA